MLQPSIQARPPRRLILPVALLFFAMAIVALWGDAFGALDPDAGAKGKRSSPAVSAAVIAAPALAARAPAAPAQGFAPQARLGYTAGDQWEPAIAADRFGRVYMLYPQYGGVPGCPSCANPTMILQTSADGGASWSAPRQIYPAGATGGQWDAQVAVDPVDGQTVYAAWLQDNKSNIVVARSNDFGATWQAVAADSTNAGTDKPILAVRGPHVYVAFNHTQRVWVASSHDGGQTFTNVIVNPNGKLGWSLAGGGTVDPSGNVYFAWAGYEQNGGAKGNVNLYISKSADGGATWTNKLLDVSAAPPDCSAYLCGWAYLGAQLTMASDAGGALYALWNAGAVDKGPERIYFAKSTNAGATWSAKLDVSTAPAGTAHAFPAIVAGSAGDVRIGWMDARAAGPLWNVYYRSSTNGGASWSSETDLSTYVGGFSYIQAGGFSYPFGDYWELAIDGQGVTHAIWGEGLNYDAPGSVWYTRGR